MQCSVAQRTLTIRQRARVEAQVPAPVRIQRAGS
jgi:hypothetical protein